MDRHTTSDLADRTANLDPGPFLRQEGRHPLRSGQGGKTRHDPLMVGRYPRRRVSLVPVWISWVARRIGPGG